MILKALSENGKSPLSTPWEGMFLSGEQRRPWSSAPELVLYGDAPIFPGALNRGRPGEPAKVRSRKMWAGPTR